MKTSLQVVGTILLAIVAAFLWLLVFDGIWQFLLFLVSYSIENISPGSAITAIIVLLATITYFVID